MNEKHPVEQIAGAVGGKITEVGVAPDGSGFAIMSVPLRMDHWIYKRTQEEFDLPPIPLRVGRNEEVVIQGEILDRKRVEDMLRRAGRYAVRCATMCGTEMDFDPDALIQNLIVGFLGYHTETGLSDMDGGMWNPKGEQWWERLDYRSTGSDGLQPTRQKSE